MSNSRSKDRFLTRERIIAESQKALDKLREILRLIDAQEVPKYLWKRNTEELGIPDVVLKLLGGDDTLSYTPVWVYEVKDDKSREDFLLVSVLVREARYQWWIHSRTHPRIWGEIIDWRSKHSYPHLKEAVAVAFDNYSSQHGRTVRSDISAEPLKSSREQTAKDHNWEDRFREHSSRGRGMAGSRGCDAGLGKPRRWPHAYDNTDDVSKSALHSKSFSRDIITPVLTK
jgi:hypothetical protein